MDPRLGLPRGEARDLFSSNLKKKRHEKKGELSEAGGDCRKHFQGCDLGRVGPFELSDNLQQEALPYQMDTAVRREGHIISV